MLIKNIHVLYTGAFHIIDADLIHTRLSFTLTCLVVKGRWLLNGGKVEGMLLFLVITKTKRP